MLLRDSMRFLKISKWSWNTLRRLKRHARPFVDKQIMWECWFSRGATEVFSSLYWIPINAEQSDLARAKKKNLDLIAKMRFYNAKKKFIFDNFDCKKRRRSGRERTVNSWWLFADLNWCNRSSEILAPRRPAPLGPGHHRGRRATATSALPKLAENIPNFLQIS